MLNYEDGFSIIFVSYNYLENIVDFFINYLRVSWGKIIYKHKPSQ